MTAIEITDVPTVWCSEVELTSGDHHRIEAPADAQLARLLVRYRRDPLGFVQLPTTVEAVGTDELVAGLPAAAQRRLADLRAAGGPVDDRIGADTPSVTVVVCTRNRGPELRDCLAGLLTVDYPELDFVIVDNAPSDGSTRRIVEETVGQDARFSYVLEPVPGLSRARNRGLQVARGTIVAYTDDDVRVDRGWVTGLVQGFARRADVACVTSLVCTASISSPSEHYFDARVSWGERCEPRLYDAVAPDGDPLYPYSAGIFGTGAGMAFRTAVIRELGGFDEALGAGTRSAGGEDLDAFVRVLQGGHALAYEPASLVWHSHRADLGGLRRQMYSYGTGLTAFYMKHLLSRSTRTELLRRVPKGVVKLAAVPKDTNRAVGQVEVPTRELMLRELAGMAAGPVLYLRSRRNVATTIPLES
jgi:GT2 family glycosyltransferase